MLAASGERLVHHLNSALFSDDSMTGNTWKYCNAALCHVKLGKGKASKTFTASLHKRNARVKRSSFRLGAFNARDHTSLCARIKSYQTRKGPLSLIVTWTCSIPHNCYSLPLAKLLPDQELRTWTPFANSNLVSRIPILHLNILKVYELHDTVMPCLTSRKSERLRMAQQYPVAICRCSRPMTFAFRQDQPGSQGIKTVWFRYIIDACFGKNTSKSSSWLKIARLQCDVDETSSGPCKKIKQSVGHPI